MGDRSSRGFWFGLIAVGVLPVLLMTGLAVAMGDDDVTAAAAAGEPVTFEIELGDIYVKPTTIDVPAGSPVTLVVSNKGQMPHDLKVAGTDGTPMLDPGGTATVEIGSFDADAQAWCTVPGHKEAGMLLDIKVAGGTAAAGGGQAAGGTTGATIDANATPEADWQPFDPDLRPAPGGTNHEIELHATEEIIEVAPGVTQKMWTFGGSVPGPIMRGKVGDIFTVTLVNDGEVDHSIDFHSSKVAWNDEMRSIASGESLVYQYEAKHAGIFMYHCGTAPALHHIGNGMYGAIVIDPPALPPVDHEFVFVQSELYLGEEGAEGDLGKMQAEAFDAVVFNGYFNQYFHKPIRVEPGERVRAWVLDAGPSENSSFHIVGTIFDTMFKEGAYTLRPDESRGGAQALDLQPAQGGFVEFTFDEPGLYLMVTHKFSNVGKGALGVFQAGDVDAGGVGGH